AGPIVPGRWLRQGLFGEGAAAGGQRGVGVRRESVGHRACRGGGAPLRAAGGGGRLRVPVRRGRTPVLRPAAASDRGTGGGVSAARAGARAHGTGGGDRYV